MKLQSTDSPWVVYSLRPKVPMKYRSRSTLWELQGQTPELNSKPWFLTLKFLENWPWTWPLFHRFFGAQTSYYFRDLQCYTRLEVGEKYLTPQIICSEVYFRCRSWIVYEIFVLKASRYQQMYIMSASRWKISRWIISGLLTCGVQPSMNWRNCKTEWW